MEQVLVSHEVAITWWIFVSAIFLIGIAETFRPRRDLSKPTGRRWIANGLLACTQVGVYVGVYALLPAGATFLAILVRNSPYGLLNRSAIPFAVNFAAGMMALDLAHYATHYFLHRFSWLWRVHQVHHSDPDFDFTTGVRTHPVEMLVTEGVHLGAIALLAPPPVAVIALSMFTAMQNLFTHANWRVPAWIDSALRRILVTPDVHRIHHSDSIAEQNTNFGFVFAWWDRLFGTFLAAPALGHEKMGIGLQGFKDARSMNILHLLAMPLWKAPDPAPSMTVADPQDATARATTASR